MDAPPPDDFDPYRDDNEMRLTEGSNTWTFIAVALNIMVTIVGIAWMQGKNDQRMATNERDIIELQAKSSKDAAQDIQIAVITTQLSIISSGVTEIKTQLGKQK